MLLKLFLQVFTNSQDMHSKQTKEQQFNRVTSKENGVLHRKQNNKAFMLHAIILNAIKHDSLCCTYNVNLIIINIETYV